MVNLEKGSRVNLEKDGVQLTKVVIGLGWKPRAGDGEEFDLDSSVFALDANDKSAKDGSGFCFYGKLSLFGGGITHSGDNIDGLGDGDDEAVTLDLSKLPTSIEKLAFVITIHKATERRQNFGMVDNAYAKVYDQNMNPLFNFDLSEKASSATAVVVGEVYRSNGQWKFKAAGNGFNGGLKQLCDAYGVGTE